MKFLLLFLSLLSPIVVFATPQNIASYAKVSCSSAISSQYGPEHLTDGVSRVLNKNEWRSDSRLDTRGRVRPFPWVRLDWDSIVSVSKVILYDRASEESHTAGGTLIFSDGSTITVNQIADNGAPKVIEFSPKKIQWLRFQVTDGEGMNLGLSEIEVYPSPESYQDYVSYVNPYIETAKGRYFFFVTGSLPFGMISAAPLTRNINQGGGGYSYNSTRVLGFPQIHDWMISGLNVMPASGEVETSKGENGWSSPFSHDGEVVQPGYHRLYLDKYQLWVEQTVTERVGFYRLTYSHDASAKVLLNLGGHISTSTMINAHAYKVSDSEIAGYFDTAGRVWGGVDVARVYFVVRFNRPFEAVNSWLGNKKEHNIKQMQGSPELIKIPGSSFKQSPTTGMEADFGQMEAGGQLLMKTSVSFVSVNNARENIDKECAQWNFDQVKKSSFDTWNNWLGKIEVKGGTPQQRIKFYTDLWHVLLGRHKIDDYNGAYPDYLTGGKRIGKRTRIHTIAPHYQAHMLPKDRKGNVKYHMYNSDALWLTQWNLNTLWGLAYPSMLDEFSASFLQYDKDGGLLPRGPSIGSYTYIMTGCPATPLITSAFQRGLCKKWQPVEGYKALKRNHEKGGMQAFDMNDELDFYIKHGYCPNEAGLTIQWSFEDWTLGQMAKTLGKNKDEKYYTKRATGWPASFHPGTGLIMPKKKNGEWLHTNPMSEEGFVQANAWQATFGLSHDIPRLAQMMGGNDSLAAKLNDAFEKSADKNFLFGRISYANQPGCSSAHVFAHVGKPWLTQYWVRRVYEQTYSYITPERGYTENDEDQGQMGGVSALMALGLFSLDGGSSSHPCYDITSPLFDEVTIHLDANYYRGKTFKIVTYNNSKQNCYIQKAALNGHAYNAYQLPHSIFVNGGILELWLGSKPNKAWGENLTHARP
ncbi:MAG: GH92 family glycosyl hydrolase [Bacteroides sp.]|jgi:predicted alpha-1,2-mannosidase|nr:GH92 family glycosyl hydrolase [Bacteroides sp.]MCI1683491.1 GH92 family glycosyl hydrolase [Bacteroides sp.]